MYLYFISYFTDSIRSFQQLTDESRMKQIAQTREPRPASCRECRTIDGLDGFGVKRRYPASHTHQPLQINATPVRPPSSSASRIPLCEMSLGSRFCLSVAVVALPAIWSYMSERQLLVKSGLRTHMLLQWENKLALGGPGLRLATSSPAGRLDPTWKLGNWKQSDEHLLLHIQMHG